MVNFEKGQIVYTESNYDGTDWEGIVIKQAIIVDGIVDVNGLIMIKEDRIRGIHISNLYNTPQEAFDKAVRFNKW